MKPPVILNNPFIIALLIAGFISVIALLSPHPGKVELNLGPQGGSVRIERSSE